MEPGRPAKHHPPKTDTVMVSIDTSNWMRHCPDSLRTGLVAVAIALLAGACSGPEGEFTVKEGPFLQSVVEKGELQAIEVSSVMPPQLTYTSQLKIVWMVEHGQMVHKGDTLVRFDPSSTLKEIENQEGLVSNAEVALRRRDLNDETAMLNAEGRLERQRGSFELSKLQLDRAQFDSENKKKIAELQFRQATMQLEREERALERLPRTQKYSRLAQDLLLKKRQGYVSKAIAELDKLVLVAPSDGLMQVANRPGTDYPYKEGDEVPSGYTAVATIPNVSQMKVASSVREVDFTKIGIGTKVLVRLDALPSVSFNGEVSYISKICVDRGNGAKSFDVEVIVRDRDPRLKPGMSVSCEYIVYESQKDLFVPSNCLLSTDSVDYVYLLRRNRPRRVEVKAGASNNHFTVVQGELEAGQALVPIEEVIHQ